MERTEYQDWYLMVRDMRRHALKTWRSTYAPAIAVDDLFALHLRRVRIACDEFPGGIWHIGIKVQPRRASEAEWYWWKARRLAGLYYIL